MATMVCHRSLQPCVDSQFIETTWPHIKFKSQIPPPFEFVAFKSCFLDLDSSKSLNQCDDVNHILSNYHNATNSVLPLPLPPSDAPKKSDDVVRREAKSPMATKELESAYVHPLVKRSRSTLSDKSLALCTENLGNETGADFLEENAVFSDLKIERSSTRKRVKSDNQGNKKLFPPPLTTIAGEDSIRVRSYREDGRLIMQAVKAPSRLSYFHAERSQGRLRLSILKSSSTPKADSNEESTEKGVEINTPNDDVEAVGEKSNYEENTRRKVEENGNLRGAEMEIKKLEMMPCKGKQGGKNHNIDENKNHTEMLLFTREALSIWVCTS